MRKRIKKFLNHCKTIEEYYNYLITLTSNHQFIGIVNEWIVDNYAVVLEHENYIRELKKNSYDKTTNFDRIEQLLFGLVERYHYKITYQNIIDELNNYQKDTNVFFTYKELSMVPYLLSMITIEKVKEVTLFEHYRLKDKESVHALIKKIHERSNKEQPMNLSHAIAFENDIKNHPTYLVYLNEQLKEFGNITKDIFHHLNHLLEVNNLNLRTIINEEHQRDVDENILVSNLFSTLQFIFKVKEETLFEKVSMSEQCLLRDPYYEDMTKETKDLYRRQIVKQAKRAHESEYLYINHLIMKAQKDQRHIGFYLLKPVPVQKRTILYLTSIFFITFIFTYLLSFVFIRPQWLGILILFVPISEVVIQIEKRIILHFTPMQPVPKMDYSEGIPKKSATMVVIPTIIKDKEKLNVMYEYLETYYLANRSKNLYFCLLADCKEHESEHYEKDQEIVDGGLQKVKDLNEKYGSSIFHFVYRKRFYNEGENSFLGYERKRGGLVHFNNLLLKRFSDVEKEKYFQAETISSLDVPITYVITLDTDTQMVLHTAEAMIGAMAHPCNVPVLNQEKTKVISGYGFMQPKVGVDIESCNRSIYSQLYAGMGGFDSYSGLVPDFYQDVFHEGCFIGKGIYNLEVFQCVLEHAFPPNLILSHDLLESNYLRCAFLSDVELIDDFPSRYLSDSTRHHRWARGDIQIMDWITPHVRNQYGKRVKNPITLLGKWKIFDNIRRMFFYPMLILVLLGAYTLGVSHPLYWLLAVLGFIALPILFYMKEQLFDRNRKEKTIKYYRDLFLGGQAILLRSLLTFVTLPHRSYIYLNASIKSIYRMFVSKKHLLSWLTAEEAEKSIGNNLSVYLKNFWPNYVLAFLFIECTIFMNTSYIMSSFLLAFYFCLAPFLLYIVSQQDSEYVELSHEKKQDLMDLAYRTWTYFEQLLTEENHYLIPDNFQYNRTVQADHKTSPTDIGFSLLSVLSAYELEFISLDKAKFYFKHIMESVKQLPKWNGHLYNWYDIKTRRVLPPNFVSSVDSGNFVASLITLKEFLREHKEEKLMSDIEQMIQNSNFKKFYSSMDVFSIGYHENEGELSVYNYNKFASESRLLSFVAIAKGDVPSKHWFCLDKTLTKYKLRKGLVSWSGTSFEYFMPAIYMKNYPNTLLDESYFFAYFCQKEFMKEIDPSMPWGISEAAYDELDDGLNYKYKAFSTPYLKLQDDRNHHIVLSPYSSVLAISENPNDVYWNLERFKKLNMYHEFGFLESYDYETKNPVFAYFAHHQGMILSSLVNYLKNNVIKNYFHKDLNVRSYEILEKEKVQLKPLIDMKIAKYKRYNYEKERIENDIRYYPYISSIPEVSVLSNSDYTVLMNDRGNGFSRYHTIQLNRYRKITEQDYGTFLYVKDLTTDRIWSNTYAPMNVKPERYEVIFASDRMKFIRLDGDITTTTEIIVTKNDQAEIRKITFKNSSRKDHDLELTTYTEPILTENPNDISHRVFSNLFLSGEFDKETNSLIMKRSKKSQTPDDYFFLHRLLIRNNTNPYQYETVRRTFLGRNRNTDHPLALYGELSNHVGTSIDPIMSMRNRVHIAPDESVSVYILNAFGRSRQQVIDIANAYDNKHKIAKAFEVSTIMNNVNTKMLHLTGPTMRVYNMMLNYLYQTSKINISDSRRHLLEQNKLSQENLWRFGISGDLPIVLLEIYDVASIGLMKELIRAFEYFKSKGIFIDFVILNGEKKEYQDVIANEVQEELYRMNTLNDFMSTPGNIFVVLDQDLSPLEKNLFQMIARLNFNTIYHSSLKEYIKELHNENEMSQSSKIPVQETKLPLEQKSLMFDNTYGGFSSDGKEYVITNPDTPTPWSNILANKNFGSIVTNNGCGFTFAYNSQEYKLTSWTNDLVLNDKSEGLFIDSQQFDPARTTHGFGYTIFENTTETLEEKVTEFVAEVDTVKFFLLKLKNKQDYDVTIPIRFWINPTLGTSEEKTSRHLLCNYLKDANVMTIQNVYSKYYSHIHTFLSSTEPIVDIDLNHVLTKGIEVLVSLHSNEEKEIAFLLGTGESEDHVRSLLKRFSSIPLVQQELEHTKSFWKNQLSLLQVKTEDKELDYMLNGWYLYQTLASRLFARSGFYQVSGAFGYRDQLQDAINVCHVHPDIARKQILTNAMHQFHEGDVLHWWQSISKFGLRSRFKDDYLWLVYATCEYLRVTKDASILDEAVCFVEGPLLLEHEAERGFVYWYSNDTKTLYEHCMLSLDLALHDLGPHGLSKMGGGDWNDGMNMVGIKGQGESVWLSFFLLDVLHRFIEVTKEYKKEYSVYEYEVFAQDLVQNINEHAWDGEYYLRAYFDNGHTLGSHENKECKIDLITQAYSILSDAIPSERIPSVLCAVEKQLVDPNLHIIKLLTPALKTMEDVPGYIMDYPEGIRENGGQYTHGAIWYIQALLKLKQYKKAYQYYQMINPIHRTKTSYDVEQYMVEPYVIAADIYSNDDYPARGGWTWYTGSAGWYYKVGMEEIIGFKKEGETLRIEPHLPFEWKSFQITYRYMDTMYYIDVCREKKASLIVDQKLVKTNIIGLVNDKVDHHVKVSVLEEEDYGNLS